MYEVFCDYCKVHPAEKLHILIPAHYCASLSVRVLIPVNMISWVWRRESLKPPFSNRVKKYLSL